MKFKKTLISALILFLVGVTVIIVSMVLGSSSLMKSIPKLISFIDDDIRTTNTDTVNEMISANAVDDDLQLNFDNAYIDIYNGNVDVPTLKYDDNKHNVEAYTDGTTFTVNGNVDGVAKGITPLVLLLPSNYKGDINIQSSNVIIDFSNVTAGKIMCNSTNTTVTLENCRIDTNISIKTDNALINADTISCTELSLSTDNALCEIEKINANNISINNGSGSVNFDELAFSNLTVTTDTGIIKGELNGTRSDYTINTSTNSVVNTLPSYKGGNKNVDIKTHTGMINIDFDD